MIKPKCEWFFTDPEVDLPRICRELEAAGACVGLVTRSDGVSTLINTDLVSDTRRMSYSLSCFAVGVGHWFCFRGDHVVAALGVRKVTVKGYAKP